MKLSERLTILINENDMSQREFATFTGITRGAVTSHLDGHGAGCGKLIKYAQAFNVSVDWLLGLSDARNGGVMEWRPDMRKEVGVAENSTAESNRPHSD